jgi:leader peptidase (prepilin peptidase)/N-methyltransferase
VRGVHPLAVLTLHVAVAGYGLRLAVVDLAEHRLPDRLTLPFAVVVLAVSWWGGSNAVLIAGFTEALLTAGAFSLVAVLPSRPLGMGDVKLQAILGFYLGAIGPGLGIIGAVLSFVIGGAVAFLLLARRKIGPTDALAFGPFMMAASFLCVWGKESGLLI